MDNAAYWFIVIIASAIGMGYIIYGRKQRAAIALIAGIGLCVYPYFTDNIYLLIGIGLALILLPFIIKY
jgi:hypothetical protein